MAQCVGAFLKQEEHTLNKTDIVSAIKRGSLSAFLAAILGTTVNAAVDTAGADFTQSKNAGLVTALGVGALVGKGGSSRLSLIAAVLAALWTYKLFND